MRSRRILIVEDDSIDRELLKSSLRENEGAFFEFAEEWVGINVFQRCEEFQPHCVLLDLNLPDMSGLDVLESLSSKGCSVPVVVITAFGNEQIAVKAMKNGATDYVVKTSLTPESLLRTVENAIEKRQLQTELDRQRQAVEHRNVELQAALGREKAATAIAEENQERFRMLTEAIPQIVWTATSPGAEFDHVSHRWFESTGLPADSALGSGWLNAVHPDDHDPVVRTWRDAVEHQSPFEVECRLGTTERGYRWHLARAVPQFEKESVLRWFGTFTDIDDRRRAEQALLQRQKLESTGLLAGGIAHDFNNLLVGILGGISYSLDILPASHESRPALENALLAGERAAMLTGQMLAYAGKGRFVIERVDLPELVRSTCNLIRASIPKMVHVNIQAGRSVPPIEGDSSQIQQIIMNLIINAAEAVGEESSGIVTVKTDVEQIGHENRTDELSPGVYAVLEVVDTGAGMSEEVQARIFEPFFTTKFTGRGLGLAAVMGIVRSAKGAITVRSAPGKGTAFRVLMPATSGALSAVKQGAEPNATVEAGTILVVDDEEIVRRATSVSIERGGYVVHTASGGTDAVAQVRRNPDLFDLVLLDMNMPDLSGEETLRQMRTINSSLHVAVFSGYSETEVAARLGGQVVAGILQKPFTWRTLLDKVSGFLSARATHV